MISIKSICVPLPRGNNEVLFSFSVELIVELNDSDRKYYSANALLIFSESGYLELVDFKN